MPGSFTKYNSNYNQNTTLNLITFYSGTLQSNNKILKEELSVINWNIQSPCETKQSQEKYITLKSIPILQTSVVNTGSEDIPDYTIEENKT